MLRYLYIMACVATLLLPSSLQWQLLYFCQMNGEMGTSCCCPHSDDEPKSGGALEKPSMNCCDAQLTSSPAPVVVAAAEIFVAPVHLVTLPSSLSWPQDDAPRRETPRMSLNARGPPPGPVAIYLQNQTLLI